MKAGTYWIGDLCYVMYSKWNHLLDVVYENDLTGYTPMNEGKFTTSDGVEFAIFSTAYGDGEYYDSDGRAYPVDSGTLGCVLLKDITIDDMAGIPSGHVVSFEKDFDVYTSKVGVIHFGDLVIATDENEYEEESEDWSEDDDDGEYEYNSSKDRYERSNRSSRIDENLNDEDY